MTNNFFDKLNMFSKYLEDTFYIKNNINKENPAIGGYYPVDFGLLTIADILNDIPKDTYLSAKFHGIDEKDTFILELIQNEYSMLKSENVIKNENAIKFATVLANIKSLLTGDDIKMELTELDDYVVRDDFSVNGKVHTIYGKLYKIKLR